MSTEAQKIIEGYRALKSRRSSFDEVLKRITYYCLPEFERKEKIGDTGTPDRPVSSKPVAATQTLGGHMFANTISTGTQWFTLRSVEDDKDDRPLMEWLDDSTMTALKAIQNSNFSEAYGSMITLYSTYGTGVLGTDYDYERDQLVFTNLPINQDLYLAENADGFVNTVYRKLYFTAAQSVDRFGYDNLPSRIQQAYMDPSKAADQFEFVHMVAPNKEQDPQRLDWRGKKYLSIYVYEADEVEVMRSGYDTFPYACPRFIKVRDWPYGYGAAHNALFTIAELNRYEAMLINAMEMASNPPIFVPDEDAVETASLVPNAINYMDMTQGKPWEYPVSGGNIQMMASHVEQLKQEVDQLFFIDVFLAISMRYKKEKTATEVEALDEEKLSSIGPMVVRLQSECFGVMLERVVDLLIKAGKINPPPESVREKGFRVVYTSRVDSKLALVQNMQAMRSAQDAANLLALGQQVPSLNYVLRLEDQAAQMLERSHVHPTLIPTKEERDEMRQAEAEQAQQEQAAATEQAMVENIDPQKTAEPGSPIERLQRATQMPQPLA